MLSMMHPFDSLMLDTMPTSRFMTYDRSRRCGTARAMMPVLKEHDDKYLLTLSAPGVAKEQVVLTETNGVLKLILDSPNSSKTWSTRLPRDADATSAHGVHVDGILTITIPKKDFAEDEHPGVSCDRSGMDPIVGKRWHLPGHNFDLCQAEYDKLGEREKALYVGMNPPPKRVKLDVTVASSTEEKTPTDDDNDAATTEPYSISLNAAGVRASDISVQVDGQEGDTMLLRVSGATEATGASLGARVYRLPRDADVHSVRAISVDGLLTITVPTKVESTTVIEIRGAEEAEEVDKDKEDDDDEEDIAMA